MRTIRVDTNLRPAYVFVLCVLLVSASQHCTGQAAAPREPVLSKPPIPEVVSTPGGRLHLDVVVTDSAGNPVPDLTGEDFSLLDGGQPTKIISFRLFKPGGEKPESVSRVILVIDALNNGFTELAFVRQGLERFLLQNGGHLAHPTSLLLFSSDGIRTVGGPSTDGIALAGMVSKLKPSVRPKGLAQFVLSLEALESIAQSEDGRPGRKIFVWLGQGWPLPDPPEKHYTNKDERDQRLEFNALVQLTAELRDARITLYGGYEASGYRLRDFVKGVGKSSQLNARSLSLDAIAIRTGGRGGLSDINRDGDLDDQLNGFMSDADTYYVLSFDPPRTDNVDEYRDLKVVIKKPGLAAHAITGYYNEPNYSLPAQEKSADKRTGGPVLRPTPPHGFIRKPVDTEQLTRLVESLKGSSDAEAERQVYEVQLIERLSTPTLVALEAKAPGEKTRAALVAIGDESAFLQVPANELLARAQPDLAEQRTMISKVVDYLGKTIPRLPNFFSERKTIRYEDTPETPTNSDAALTGGQAWRIVGKTATVVEYRDGKEILNPEGNSSQRKQQRGQGLITRGTFGPILSMMIVDASHGEMTFDHWERGPSGDESVFNYKVPENQSHYAVAFQSPPGEEAGEVQQHTAYHGEVAIDPSSGAILRIALIADLAADDPITRGDVMVEYASMEIGGKDYICPVRSISVSVGQSGKTSGHAKGATPIHTVDRTLLNDVSFSDYHVFRSDLRIITGEPDVNPQ